MRNRFPLSSDDCELILALEDCPSLAELAKKFHRDHSIISRAFKRISEHYPVVEKKAGKWCLTEIGKRINDSSRIAIASQLDTFQTTRTLRIGTNREFAARILGPNFKSIQDLFPGTILEISAFERGTEQALLQGQIDIGIDCDRPFDPTISYKQVIDEPIVSVSCKEFVKKNRKKIEEGFYYKLPHLLCERLNPDKIFSKPDNQFIISSRFNDIATTRAACIQGAGWALLPRYAVLEELTSGKLVQIDSEAYGSSKYGVWWVRHKKYLKVESEKIIRWLESREF